MNRAPNKSEFVLSSRGRVVRFSGAWLLCVREEAECHRPIGLRGGSHGVSVFRFECHSTDCHRVDFRRSSLLCQDLIHYE